MSSGQSQEAAVGAPKARSSAGAMRSGTTVFTPKDPDAAGWTQAQNQASCIAQAVGNALVQSCADTPTDAETVQKAFIDKINSSTGKH